MAAGPGMSGGSAAGAVSAAGPLGGSPTGYPGAYTGTLTLEEWKKRKGMLPGAYMGLDATEQWEQYNVGQVAARPWNEGITYPAKPEEPKFEAKQDVGSSPGFEKVQRYLRQQRATGRVVSDEETRMAWQGYWDAWAGKQTEREKIGIERERLDFQKWFAAEQLGMSKDEMEYRREQQKSAAKSKGMGMIGMGVGFAVGGPVGGVIGGIIGGVIGGSM